MKTVSAEIIVVQTTIWPASVASPPISCVIGTLETDIGVAKIATNAAKCAPVKLERKKKYAHPMQSEGTRTVRIRIPKAISFLSEEIAENSN